MLTKALCSLHSGPSVISLGWEILNEASMFVCGASGGSRFLSLDSITIQILSYEIVFRSTCWCLHPCDILVNHWSHCLNYTVLLQIFCMAIVPFFWQFNTGDMFSMKVRVTVLLRNTFSPSYVICIWCNVDIIFFEDNVLLLDLEVEASWYPRPWPSFRHKVWWCLGFIL